MIEIEVIIKGVHRKRRNDEDWSIDVNQYTVSSDSTKR